MGKTDAEPEAAPADAAPEVAPAAAADKKDGNAKPGDVEQKADSKSFDGFLSGKKPNGKSRRCTDCLCLLLIVSSSILSKLDTASCIAKNLLSLKVTLMNR